MTDTVEDRGGAPHKTTLTALLEHHARVGPDQIALVEEEGAPR